MHVFCQINLSWIFRKFYMFINLPLIFEFFAPRHTKSNLLSQDKTSIARCHITSRYRFHSLSILFLICSRMLKILGISLVFFLQQKFDNIYNLSLCFQFLLVLIIRFVLFSATWLFRLPYHSYQTALLVKQPPRPLIKANFRVFREPTQ